MPPPHSPWMEAMLHQLADGRWYHREEIIRTGMRAIPPGRAIQQREHRRVEGLRTGTGPRRDCTDEQRILAGARDLARRAIDAAVRRGAIERRGDLVRTAR